MKPLFTVHAAEYLVGNYIERRFSNLEVWLPSRDTGVDLLVTFKRQRSIGLQVKFSRDYLVTHVKSDVYQAKLRAFGWWTLKRSAIENSAADYWVLVLAGFQHRTTDYIVVPTHALLERLDSIHGRIPTLQVYLWVTAANRCFETRSLHESGKLAVASGTFRDRARDFSQFLNNWRRIQVLNGR